MGSGIGASPPLMTPDHVHFTPAGYVKGADLFLDALIPVIEKLQVRPQHHSQQLIGNNARPLQARQNGLLASFMASHRVMPMSRSIMSLMVTSICRSSARRRHVFSNAIKPRPSRLRFRQFRPSLICAMLMALSFISNSAKPRQRRRRQGATA
jgi:hypothetical protein